ncbi:hypothetical protein EV359DRAFT_81595 [Lentinula novae-zelandiae]|nr:hypothetical protein EV359DRAFT_81595 [Lentinula novae-zelandiae]
MPSYKETRWLQDLRARSRSNKRTLEAEIDIAFKILGICCLVAFGKTNTDAEENARRSTLYTILASAITAILGAGTQVEASPESDRDLLMAGQAPSHSLKLRSKVAAAPGGSAIRLSSATISRHPTAPLHFLD